MDSQEQETGIANARRKLIGQPHDVTIIAGKGRIRAHKSLLASRCHYFNCMFTGGFKESAANTVAIKQMDDRAIETIINYFYTDIIAIDDSNVVELLACSILLQSDDVISRCTSYFKDNLDADNCIGILVTAEQNALVDLIPSAIVHCLKHFEKVEQTDEFLQLSLESLIAIVSSDHLEVTFEHIVEMAILRWIDHNVADRQLHLPTLMKHVRVEPALLRYLRPIKPRQHWFKVTSEKRIPYKINLSSRTTSATNEVASLSQRGAPVSSTPTCSTPISSTNFSNSAPTPVGLRTDQTKQASNQPTKPNDQSTNQPDQSKNQANQMSMMKWVSRKWVSRKLDVEKMGAEEWGFTRFRRRWGRNRLYCVGCYDKFMNTYNPATSEWSRVGDEMEYHVYRNCGLVALDDRLYAVSGEKSTCRIEFYDPPIGEWNSNMRPPPPGITFCPAYAGLDGFLYIISNWFMFRYDPKCDTWIKCRPLADSSSGMKATSLDGCIYVLSGCKNNIVQRFDPRTDRWDKVAPMAQTDREGFDCTSLNGCLYTIVKRKQEFSLVGETYEPRTNSWRPIAPYGECGQASPAIAALDGLIYAVSAPWSEKDNILLMGAYDPIKNEWNLRSSPELFASNYREGTFVATM